MSELPVKKCDYCPAEGTMPTFIDGETICYICLDKRPKSIAEATKLIFQQQAELERAWVAAEIKQTQLTDSQHDADSLEAALEKIAEGSHIIPAAVAKEALLQYRGSE